MIDRGDILRGECPDVDPLLNHAARQVICVQATDLAQTAIRVMLDEHVEHVPVVDDDGRLIGICTRTDLLKVRRRQLDLERVQAGIIASRSRP